MFVRSNVVHSFATVPDVTWDDIGALEELHEELQFNVLQPILDPEMYRSIGLSRPAGIATTARLLVGTQLQCSCVNR